MKMIEAIIKPYRLDQVREAVEAIGITGMTLTEVKGFGKQRGHAELYRGAEYQVEFVPKVKLEIAVSADKLEQTLEEILKASHTGKVGDGKIFVYDIEDCLKIRTQERGVKAL